eukprot:CAMPEP_0117437770 /NCGR_PEP_ID=MMETSP0759-20121206/1703_1 /TAXON_ID=63605 /ORGANISM="Percolomonas cosmopolitus, Strain WS" /LENGTH=1357 /DNA_ID=CAMNT_0005229429 /DNA_START=239 /DNA_END=4308 /DNA_ORIENTATION=-
MESFSNDQSDDNSIDIPHESSYERDSSQHSDSFSFNESEERDAEYQLMIAIEEERQNEKQRWDSYGEYNKNDHDDEYDNENAENGRDWESIEPQEDTESQDEYLDNGGDQHLPNGNPIKIPFQKNPLVSQSRRDEKFQSETDPRRSLSARKRLSLASAPPSSVPSKKLPPNVMTPRTNYYDRLRRIQRVHSSPKYLFRGGIGVTHFTDVARAKFGDSLVSNYELLDRRKQLMKKYTNVHSPPYQPTGKYEEPKKFLHERLAEKQKRKSSLSANSVTASPNTHQRRKQYGRKVWNNRVKMEENKYKQIKRAQTLNQLDTLRQEWIQLNQWMKQMDPRMIEQIPALDSDTVGLSEEMDDMQSQLWPDAKFRPQANVVSTENHRLLNSSLMEAQEDEEEMDIHEQLQENDYPPHESPSQNRPQPSQNGGRKLFLEDTSPIRQNAKSDKQVQNTQTHHIRIPSPVPVTDSPLNETLNITNTTTVSPVRTPTRSGSMEPSHASELLSKAKSVLRRTSQLFERFDEAIGEPSTSQLSAMRDSFKYDSDDNSDFGDEPHFVAPIHEGIDEQMIEMQSQIPIVQAHQPEAVEPMPEVRDGDLPFVFQFFPAEHVHRIFALVCSTWFNISRADRMWYLIYKAKYGVSLRLVEDARSQFMTRLELERQNSLRGAACFHFDEVEPYSDLFKFPTSLVEVSHLQHIYHLNQMDRIRRETAERIACFLSDEWTRQAPFSVLAKELFPDLIFGAHDHGKKEISDTSTQRDVSAQILFVDKSKEYETKIKEAQEQLNKSKMVISAHPLNKDAKNRVSVMKQLPQQEAQLKRLVKRLEKEELETDREREQFFSDVPFYRDVLINNWRSFINSRRELFSHFANPNNILVDRFESNVSVSVMGDLEYGELVSEMILFGTSGEEVRLECLVRYHPDSKARSGVAHEFDLVLKISEDSFFQMFDESGNVNDSALQQLCTVLLGEKYNDQDEIQGVGCLWFTLMLLMPTDSVCKVPNDEFLFQLYHKSMSYAINYDAFGYQMLKRISASRPRVSKPSKSGFLPSLSKLPSVVSPTHKVAFFKLTPALISYICGFLRYQDLVPGALMLNKRWNSCLSYNAQLGDSESSQAFWRQMFSNELGAPLDFIHQAPKERFTTLWRKVTDHRFIPFIDCTNFSLNSGSSELSNKVAMTLCAQEVTRRLHTFMNQPDSLMEFFDLQVEGPPSVEVESVDVWKYYLQRHRHAEFLKYFAEHPLAFFIQDVKLQVSPRKSAPHKVDIVAHTTYVSVHYRGMSLRVKLSCEFHPQRKRSSPYTFKVEYKGGEDALQQFLDIYLMHELGVHVDRTKENTANRRLSPSSKKHGHQRRSHGANRRTSIQSPP